MSRRVNNEASNSPRDGPLADFLPEVQDWFTGTFEAPSPAQVAAWPVIARGENVLLLAPTGSGKTLSAFMCAIDRLFRKAAVGELSDAVHVLYITPLKALGNDIERNLLVPLRQIRERSGGTLPEIRVGVRSGDTSQNERARMVRTPPHILITTPESLFLLLQSKQMRPNLAQVEAVIVDEVHALCSDKRGVHLAVSLERLAEGLAIPPQRIGCSATLRPLAEIAAYLVGFDDEGERRPCTIVDAGMRKQLDVRVMAPLADFVEVGHSALWASAYDLLLQEIDAHTTTLVFGNSRYKAERTVLRLRELDEGAHRIGVHHGSVARERRFAAEQALKSGELDALVATTSLELGIDIGSVDLVYQLESPKSVATGLQRIGRAGHLLHATSKGRVLVFDRDELFEAAAICRSMVRGEIDAVSIPTGCIDVLAQQIVGAVVTHEWTVDGLLQLLRRSYPYRALRRDCLEGVLRMLSGDLLQSMSRRPRPLVLWDHAGDRLTSARAAKLISAMNVGTIGETSEYEVVIEGTKKRVGKVQSEFADDQLRTGDIFVLGSTPWRVMGVHRNRILVKEAPGATPSVPWWTGPIPPRTVEAGEQVGRLRREVSQRLADPELLDWLEREYMMGPNAAKAAADYVREQKAAVDVVPDHENLLVETWRDELGRLNVIIHSPFGERTNRTWGLVLREAAKSTLGQVWTTAATNDHVLMTFPVPTTPPARRPDAEALIRLVTVGALDALVETVAQGAVGAGSTFREAATCALQIERMRQGRHVPIWLQNLQAEELFAAASLDGEHPILEEVRREIQLRTFDVEGLAGVLERIEAGTIAVCHQRVESPSPFAHSALVKDMYQGGYEMGRDRRAHLLHLHRRVLQQVLTREQMAELLDQRAIERIENRLQCRSERGRARTADELAQVLRRLGDIPAALEAVVAVTEGDAGILLAELCRDGRVVGIELPDCDADAIRLVPSELWRQYHDAFHHGRSRLQVLNPVIHATPWAFEPKAASDVIAARLLRRMPRAEARCAVVTRYLASHGPMTPYEIANRTGWPVPEIDRILDGLVESGSVAKGVYTVEKSQPQFVDRAVLEDIHRLTMRFLKRELSACAPYEVVDFMTRWQHVHPDTRLEGIDGLRDVIHQLQGIETVTGALESEVLANRVVDYNPQMLERLMASGEASWRCFGVRKIVRGKVALCRRQDAPWLSAGGTRQYNPEEAADQDIREEILKVRDYFATHPTAFFDDVVADTGVGADAVLRAVWYLAWCGEVTCDTYECLRHAHFQSTLSACYDLDSTPRKIVNGRMSADRVIKQMGRRKLNARLGRWSATERLLGTPDELSRDTTLRNWADQVLRRWGIVTRDMLSAETTAPAWGELLPELKRLELLGRVSRGYFIEHHHGEQYGLPDAIELLRDCRARRSEGNELGYLVDEPTFCVTTREPANLYASSFDIIDERGEVLPRTARRGNLKHRTVLQAGQVLVHNGHQTVTLSQEALRRCIEAMVLTVGAPGMELVLHDWNGFPLDVSPVAPLLYDAGFRFDSRGNMQKPPRGKSKGAPNKALQDVYLPYFAEPNPVTYGPEWTVGRAADAVQPVLQRLLSLLEEEWASGAWEMVWGCEGPKVTYRGTGRVHLYIARSFVQVCFGARAVTDEDGQRHQMATWRRYPGMRVKEPTDLTDEFRRDLHRLHEQVKALTDRYHASRGPRADGG